MERERRRKEEAGRTRRGNKEVCKEINRRGGRGQKNN